MHSVTRNTCQPRPGRPCRDGVHTFGSTYKASASTSSLPSSVSIEPFTQALRPSTFTLLARTTRNWLAVVGALYRTFRYAVIPIRFGNE